MSTEELIALAHEWGIQSEQDYEAFCLLVKEYPDRYQDLMDHLINIYTGKPIFKNGVVDNVCNVISDVILGGWQSYDDYFYDDYYEDEE